MEPIFAEWAPKYAERGIYVFPCVRGAKKPITEHGFEDASIDPEVIADWCKRYPNANIGIAMGKSGLFVLDVDLKHEGVDASWAKLLEEIPDLKNTLWARTGTGGLHVYMNARATLELGNGTGDLPHGFDIRGVGGYTIAPPSVNVDGNAYSWENFNERIDVPLELIAHLEVTKWTPVSVDASEKIHAGQGRRNPFLWKLACSLRGRGFGESAIFGAVMATNLEQLEPPKPEDVVADICHRAASYPPGEALELAKTLPSQTKFNGAKQGRKKFKLTAYSDVKAIDLEWLMPGFIARGKFNLMWGMEGRGKSYATIGIASALSRGEALPGNMALEGKPISTLLLTYEDDPNDTIAPRLIKCDADMSRVYTVHYEDGLVNAKEVAAFTETIEEIPDLGLVVIDPLLAFAAGIDDNSESQVREAMNPLIQLAFKKKFAIVGLKHANKDEKLSVSNRTGGSRGWTALARSVFLVGHDNEKEQVQGHTYGGMIATKGNFGLFKPLTYEIEEGVFRFTGPDPSLTPERLMPKKKDKDE